MEYAMDPKIAKINELLAKEDERFDIVGGYEAILSGLVSQVGDVYGANTAKNFCYQIGIKPGDTIARKILETRGGKLFDDPVDAFVNLLGRLKAYYKVQVKDTVRNADGSFTIKFLNNCYLDLLYNRHPDVTKGGVLCRVTKGYLESALKTLTGKKVIYESTTTSEAHCQSELTFY
jgi:hypothetical protein